MFVPLSVLEFRDRAAMFFADKVGVIDGDAQFTYRAFATRTHRLANVLVELGVAPRDRVSAKDLRAWCRDHLAAHKVPREIHLRDALPKGGTGKILKAELREPFWVGLESRVH